jgi:hypothetical protein
MDDPVGSHDRHEARSYEIRLKLHSPPDDKPETNYRRDLIDEGDRCGPGEVQDPIGPDPDDRQDRNQCGGEGQGRLLGSCFVSVGRGHPEESEPPDQPSERRSEHHVPSIAWLSHAVLSERPCDQLGQRHAN